MSQDEYFLPEIHSTRENSVCEQLMLEDMTATDISCIDKEVAENTIISSLVEVKVLYLLKFAVKSHTMT